jgi:hypothetical protein
MRSRLRPRVRGRVVRVGAGVAFATAILLVLVAAIPSRRTLFVGIYVLFLGAVAVGALVGSFRTLEPEAWQRSPFERDPEKPERPPPLAELERIDRLVVLGAANEFDLHYRLRPLLRQLAGDRLYGRHGVELDRHPERARQLLGDELWELVRPEREVGRRTGPGLPPAELAGYVDRLERL